MARKRDKDNESRVLFARLNKLWTEVSFADWTAWFIELAPLSKFSRLKYHIKGLCPFHQESSPSFIITPEKGMASCFGCHKIFTNPVHFVAALKNVSFGEAILAIQKRFGLRAAIPTPLYERVRDHEAHQKNKAALMQYFGELLLTAIAAYSTGTLAQEGLLWAEPAVKYLLDRKLGEEPNGTTSSGDFDPHGIWSALCGQGLIGLFPPQAFITNKFEEANSDVCKFFSSYFGKFTEGFQHTGYLIFPYDETPELICRFKLREPTREKPAQEWVADSFETEMGGFRGFYGLRYYKTVIADQTLANDGSERILTSQLVEGEFDVLASITQQIRKASDDYITLGLGGGSAQPVDRLLQFGINKAWIVPDADKGGLEFAERVMKATKSKDISFKIFEYPEECLNYYCPTDPLARIKDPDEAIQRLGYDRWARHVCNEKAFLHAHEWCYERVSKDVGKGNAEDVQFVSRIAKEWGSLLRDSQSSSAFCDAVANNFGLDAGVLKRDICTQGETEASFIERIMNVLSDKFHVIGVQLTEMRRRALMLWHKETRIVETVILNDDKNAETFISTYYGPIYNFIKDELGEPSFLVNDEDETAFDVSLRSKKYREYLNYALLSLAQGKVVIRTADTKAQGLHMIESTAQSMKSYMVNGRDVFKIIHEGAGVQVFRLDGPSDDGIIFDNHEDPWIATVKTIDDFKASGVDLVDTFTKIHKILNVGWSFKYQKLDTVFLAAHMMSIAVITIFTRQTLVMLNAEPESGKSKFTSGLVGGAHSKINIIAHSKTMNIYTPASIRQQHNNCSLHLCLEEFEDYGNNEAKSVIVRKVLEMLRDLISDTAVNVSIGTPSGESKNFKLRFPLMVSAIHPLRDAASISRFMRFELVKDIGHQDPINAILAEYTEEEIKQIRHELVVGLIPHMLTLKGVQHAIEKEYATGGNLPAHASSRFRDNMYSVLSILKFLKDLAIAKGTPEAIPDYKQFAYDFSVSRKDHLALMKTQSQYEQLLETIMSAPIQTALIGDKELSAGTTRLREMLSHLNRLEDINRARQGVYIDIKMEWLVINWIEATQSLLAQSTYRADKPAFLKQTAERSPHHIATDHVRNSRVLERLIYVMGPCQPLDAISVFSVKHILDEMRALRDTAMDTTSSQKLKVEQEIDVNMPQTGDDIVV